MWFKIYRDEAFEKYWKGRIYRHPEDKHLKILAKKLFYAGWEHGRFQLRKEVKDGGEIIC